MTKRLISFIIATLSITTCFAQAGLDFSPSTWDFGDIREENGRVSHTFTGVNRTEKPLVILDVVATCGCTVPEFSRKPIPPGGRTQIVVTFDPDNRPGLFTKKLGVYSSERRKIAELTIRGNVEPRPRSIEELYPIATTGGLRLNSTLCAFTYLYPGREVHSSVGYVNTSDRPLRLELRPRTQSGLLRVNAPQTIAPGERGEIDLGYLIPAQEPRYGTIRDALEIFVDGKTDRTILAAHGIGIDPPSGAKDRAPKAVISENMLKFGAVKHDGPIRRLPFTLRNTGHSDLIVRAVECGEGLGTTLRAGMRIRPGESFDAEATLDPSKRDYGLTTDYIVLIANDPERPMRRLRITALVEQ